MSATTSSRPVATPPHRTLYTIRDIDPIVWRQVKVKAAQEGKPIRTVLLELIAGYVKG